MGLPVKAPCVLIVDDSADDARLMTYQLRREHPGLHARRVEDAEDMAQALRESSWDLVISDHSMPRFDSLSAMRVLREAQLDIPFVVYSAHYDLQQGIAAMSTGAADFVNKSSPERLLPVVRRELRNARVRREKERAERAAEEALLIDELTGLPNRKLLLRWLCARGDEPGCAAVVCLDIDRFMRINDSFGAAAADALLVQVMERLQGVLRPGDVLARLAADRFACLLEGVPDAAEARARARELLESLSEGFRHQGQELFVTASAGCALFPEHGDNAEALLRCAESAMANAKRRGRNQLSLYDPGAGGKLSLSLRLESALHHAAERNEFFLEYQPMLQRRGSVIDVAEALVRWRHPRFGVVPPDQFIPIADESGHIVEIGDWVLRHACTQAVQWRSQGHEMMTVSVNVSASQFRDPRLAERVRSALAESGLPGKALEIEITESVAMEDAEYAVTTLRSLKSLGVRIAIDDFGTGYSSLSYLKRFPLDILKIDRAFVRNLPRDAEDLSIVRAVVGLARALGLEVVAEGVETREQYRILGDEGVNRIQGYWLSKPLAAEALCGLLGRPVAMPC
jgi:diguanylate cyclase (GGDEF)-like protein